MTRMTRISAGAALFALAAFSTLAAADGRSYNDGPVINVSSIRTAEGHFDDYMAWLATGWKKQQEAAKKAGLITRYEVLLVEARGPHDPDVYLVTEYKNWAALDNLGGKYDALTIQTEGSLEKSDQADAERNKIRTVLGSQTVQVAILK